MNKYYGIFVHVSIMIFIGFGFLMTFLKRFGYSALGINMLLGVLAFLWNVLVRRGLGPSGACVGAVLHRCSTGSLWMFAARTGSCAL